MADTVAVMNKGAIEQMGAPEELYELPKTTFVANFLGQSNLIRAAVTGTVGRDLLLDVHGARLGMPSARRNSGTDDLLIGIRPEKIHISPAGADRGESNRLEGGVVTDASFTGVSTQYLVRMPWGQELMVFAQNVGVGTVLHRGTEVDLQWDPAHTFALDGTGDVNAGADVDDEAAPVAVGSS